MQNSANPAASIAATRTAHPGTLRQIKDLPGPRGLPILGNLLQIKASRIHLDVENWAQEFGKLFRIRFGKTQMLVVADHELLAIIMRDRPDGFRRSPLSGRIATEMGLPQGVFNAEGDDWRKQRRMVMASFSPSHVRAYFPSLVKVTLRLRGRWAQAAGAGTAINLQADLMRYTVDAIAGLAFGKDINTLESGEDIIQRHLDQVLPSIFRRAFSRLPYWRYFKLERDRALDRSVAVINATITDYVAQARSRLMADPSLREQPRNLLDAMIVAVDQPDSELGDKQVVGNVLTMLLAGEDTTANTLAWMIHLLHRNPDALQRLQNEVRSLAPDPEKFTMEMMDSLAFLDACANETMRLKPVAPFMPMMALRDSVVGDVAVPKNAMVWGVLRHDSVSSEYFEHPKDFKPERWLPEAAQPLGTEARRSNLPFGSGPRMCPGRYLALLEMKMAMAMLLSSFDVEAVDTPDGQMAEELMAFTMNPIGLTLKLRERNGKQLEKV